MMGARERVFEHCLPPELWLQILAKLPVRDILRFRCICRSWCSNIDYHPHLGLQILVRLPVKTLLRFRSVCRTWRSLIDDPDFALMHRTISEKSSDNSCILTIAEYFYGFDFRQELRVDVRRRERFRVCEELWSFRYSHTGHDHRNYEHWVYLDGVLLMARIGEYSGPIEITLWNPSIRKCVKLPPFSFGVCSLGPILFGYDPSTNNYKVIIVLYPDCQPRCVLAVYALKAGCWTLDYRVTLDTYVKVNRWRDASNMVVLKGVAHWLAYGLEKGYTYHISFEFASETFSCTKLPEDGHDSRERIALPFRLRGSLAVFSISPTHSSIWVMGDHGALELWGEEYARDAYLHIYEFFKARQDCIRIFLYDEKDNKFLFTDHQFARCYDVKRHEIEDLERIFWPYCHMDPYEESLHLCKALDGQTLTSFPEVV